MSGPTGRIDPQDSPRGMKDSAQEGLPPDKMPPEKRSPGEGKPKN
jgi:hypothetical protein